MAAHGNVGPGVTAPDQPRTAPFARTYEGTTVALRGVRADVVSWLVGTGADGEALERSALVVSELAANAVQAGPGRRFEVRARREGAHVVVVVRNPSDGDRPPGRTEWRPAEPLAPRGRGLAIVDALADGVEVGVEGDEVVITARLRIDGNG